jgi:hypothetical protein
VNSRKRNKAPKRSTNPTEPISYAAARLSIGINQAYRAAKRGDFPTILINERRLVLVEPFEKLISEGAL